MHRIFTLAEAYRLSAPHRRCAARAAGSTIGRWALPGGFVEVGETVEEAADREAAEETGLAVEVARLVGVYSDPERDPRGHNVSVAFLARVLSGELAAASDAAEVAVMDPASVELAFDHSKIIEDALSVCQP